MKRLPWLTDIHLNFVAVRAIEALCVRIAETLPDAVLLSGDIGEAPSVASYLAHLAKRLDRDIYFVLGNHDFYGSSIARVRAAMDDLCAATPRLRYLNRAGVVELGPETGLVGHDGWADARAGDYAHSGVLLNDYQLIEEISGLGRAERGRRLRDLGDEAAAHFRAVLPAALERFPHVIVVTHVPPFKEACWHEGKLSADDWLPHFTGVAAGEALAEAMRARPDRRMTVLCGHTHGAGEADILPNLHVSTGGAAYGAPAVQRVIVV